MYSSDAILPDELIARCLEQGLTLALAESCTGGLLASTITDVPGASEVFLGSAVTYANSAKEKLLRVSPALLSEHGAVSEPVALAMAQGACKVFNADISAAITGIAGPGGGSAAKPIGTVFIAICFKGNTVCKRHLFEGDRTSVRQQSAKAALEMLVDTLLA